MDSFINTWSFLIQFINITIIILLVRHFLIQPYLKYYIEEDKKRKKLEADYEKISGLIEESVVSAELIIANAKKESLVIRNNSETISRSEWEKIINEAKDEAENIKTKAHLNIENERTAMFEEIWNRVLQVALKINEKLFTKHESNIDFIKKSLKEENIK